MSKSKITKAQRLMALLNHGDLPGFIEQLIREEYERRNGPLVLKEEAQGYGKKGKHK